MKATITAVIVALFTPTSFVGAGAQEHPAGARAQLEGVSSATTAPEPSRPKPAITFIDQLIQGSPWTAMIIGGNSGSVELMFERTGGKLAVFIQNAQIPGGGGDSARKSMKFVEFNEARSLLTFTTPLGGEYEIDPQRVTYIAPQIRGEQEGESPTTYASPPPPGNPKILPRSASAGNSNVTKGGKASAV